MFLFMSPLKRGFETVTRFAGKRLGAQSIPGTIVTLAQGFSCARLFRKIQMGRTLVNGEYILSAQVVARFKVDRSCALDKSWRKGCVESEEAPFHFEIKEAVRAQSVSNRSIGEVTQIS